MLKNATKPMEWIIDLEPDERQRAKSYLIDQAEHLLRTSSYPDYEWEDLLVEMEESDKKAYQILEKIKASQLCPIRDIGRWMTSYAAKYAVNKIN